MCVWFRGIHCTTTAAACCSAISNNIVQLHNCCVCIFPIRLYHACQYVHRHHIPQIPVPAFLHTSGFITSESYASVFIPPPRTTPLPHHRTRLLQIARRRKSKSKKIKMKTPSIPRDVIIRKRKNCVAPFHQSIPTHPFGSQPVKCLHAADCFDFFFLLARHVAAEGLRFEPVYDDEDAVTGWEDVRSLPSR